MKKATNTFTRRAVTGRVAAIAAAAVLAGGTVIAVPHTASAQSSQGAPDAQENAPAGSSRAAIDDFAAWWHGVVGYEGGSPDASWSQLSSLAVANVPVSLVSIVLAPFMFIEDALSS